MVITGFPRSGSSLLYLLITGSAKGIKFINNSEAVAGEGIWCKDPFACIRYPTRKDFLLTVRDPRDIVSSNSHKSFPGQFVVGWTKDEGQAPYGLRDHWEAIRDRDDPIIRYEHLVNEPNTVQIALGDALGLRFDKDWSTWPMGWPEIHEYWLNTGLGEVREIGARVSTPKQEARIAQIWDRHPDFRECCERLGYLD